MAREVTELFECFHCGARGVIWDADFNSEEYGYREGGLVHACHCTKCGAEILYLILPAEDEEDDA